MQAGEWIKQRREQLKLSQEELAARLQTFGLDVTRGTVSHWEKNRYSSPLASLEAVAALAKALEVDLSELLSVVEVEAPKVQSLSWKEKQALNAWRRGDKEEAIRIIVSDR